MLVATKLCLSRHLFFFSFFATNIGRDKHVFVVTKVLSRQAYFCRDKTRVLSRQTRVCPDKSKHVSTKLLSRQNYVCRDKHTFCRDKRRVLSRQKWYLWLHSPVHRLDLPPPRHRSAFISPPISRPRGSYIDMYVRQLSVVWCVPLTRGSIVWLIIIITTSVYASRCLTGGVYNAVRSVYSDRVSHSGFYAQSARAVTSKRT